MAARLTLNGVPLGDDETLSSGEVARLMSVSPKTVSAWSKAGKLPADVRTLGGHRRWYVKTVRALLAELDSEGGGADG